MFTGNCVCFDDPCRDGFSVRAQVVHLMQKLALFKQGLK